MSYRKLQDMNPGYSLHYASERSCAHSVLLLVTITVFLSATFISLPILFPTTSFNDDTFIEDRFKRDLTESQENVEAVDQNYQRRLPQAIIIGAKKSGTRALLEFLRLNSKVKGPGPEVHFFDRHFDRGLEWYRQQMPPTSDDEITVEKTPSYLITKTVPQRVRAMNPNTKLIIVLRDPVTRAISDYTQTSSKRAGMPSFEEMAFDTETGDVNTSWGAIKIGLYHRHVKRWLRYFPLSQIHFVNGERLISHPAKELRKVEKFLNLDPEVKASNFEFNETKGFACIVKYDSSADNRLTDNDAYARRSNKFKVSKKVHCLGRTKGRTHPDIDPDAIDRLRAFYILENDKFFRLIGRKFHW